MDNANLEAKIKNLTYVVIVGFIVTFLLLIGLYFNNQGTATTNSNGGGSSTSTGTGSSTKTYDTSKLTLLDKEKTQELIESKGIKFIYVGRSGCPGCQTLLPNLNQVIDDLKLDINYLSIDLKGWKEEYDAIFSHLNLETTIKSSKGTSTGKYGELLKENGFTPIILVLKDGEQIDGLVGSRSVADLKTFFNKYI